MRPTAFVIDGIEYPALPVENAYREYTESTLQQQPEIAGTSRPSKTARPDVLTWRLDDWAGGEGQKFFRPDKEFSDRQYLETSGPVDVGTAGQVKLGLVTVSGNDKSLATITRGPYVFVAQDKPWYEYGFDINTTKISDYTGGAWTAETSLSIAEPLGPPSIIGQYAFSGQTNRISRINLNAKTAADVVSTAGSAAIVANNRVHWWVSTGAGGDLQLRRAPLALATTDTLVYTANAVTSALASEAVGFRVYGIGQESGESPRLHVFEQDVGTERLLFPVGFRILASPLSGRFGAMCQLNDVLFVVGYVAGATGDPDTAVIFYVTPDTYGQVAQVRAGTSMRFTTCTPVAQNELLIGTNVGTVYRYDMTTGAISEFINTDSATDIITSITYHNGEYFLGTLNSGGTAGRIKKTLATGNNKYPTSSTLTHSTWDYGLPDEIKILTEIEIHSETLPAGTSVEVQVVLDDTTTVTADASGATVAHSSGTRSTFTMSNATTERTFRYAKPKVILKSDSNKSATPTEVGVTLRAITAGVVRFFEVNLDLSDDNAQTRLEGFQVPGEARAEAITDLVENAESASTSASKLFSFQPIFLEPKSNPGNSSTYVVALVNHSLQLGTKGEGSARLLLRRIS